MGIGKREAGSGKREAGTTGLQQRKVGPRQPFGLSASPLLRFSAAPLLRRLRCPLFRCPLSAVRFPLRLTAADAGMRRGISPCTCLQRTAGSRQRTAEAADSGAGEEAEKRRSGEAEK